MYAYCIRCKYFRSSPILCSFEKILGSVQSYVLTRKYTAASAFGSILLSWTRFVTRFFSGTHCGCAKSNSMDGVDPFSYVAASRIRVLVRGGNADIYELLKRLNPIRLSEFADVEGVEEEDNDRHVEMFSPQAFPEGQIVYNFVRKQDFRHEILHTYEIYRRTWAVVEIIDEIVPNFEKYIEDELHSLKRSCPEALVVRFFVLDAPDMSVAFIPEIVALEVGAAMDQAVWRSMICDLTLDLLEGFSIFAQEIDLRVWIESPCVAVQKEGSLEGVHEGFVGSMFHEQASLPVISSIQQSKMQLKGRKSKIIADLYLLSGRVLDALKGYTDAAIMAKSSNDYLWHGSALEGIGVCLVILSFLQIEYQIPMIALPSSPPQLEKITFLRNVFAKEVESDASKQHIFDFLPDLHLNIIDFYQKSYSCPNDRVPPICFSESILRLCKLFCVVHLSGGWNDISLRSIIYDQSYSIPESHSAGYPPRAEIASWAMRAHTSYLKELDVIDKCRIYGGLASILGMVGFRRSRAMFLREIVSTLTPVLVNAKVDGISDDTVSSIVQIALTNYPFFQKQENVKNSTFLAHNLLDDLCDCYGIPGIGKRNNTRFEIELLERYGWPSLKITILKECILFCEALPDFSGVLDFTTKMLSIASTYLSRDNQIRLASNIPRIILMIRRLGLEELEADYWDPNIVQSIEYIPSSSKFLPILHSSLELNNVNKDNTFLQTDPFIYNPFTRKNNLPTKHVLVQGDVVEFKVVLHNPLAFELECTDISLFTEGVKFESQSTSIVIGPQRIHMVRLFGCPKESGNFVVKGCRIRLSGCKDDVFLLNRDISSLDYEHLFSNVFFQGKTKFMGFDVYSVIKASVASNHIEGYIKNSLTLPMTLEQNFEVLPAQPVLIVTRTSLVNESIMLRTFTITIKNVSDVSINFLLLSFMDSTIDPLKDALACKDISCEEAYELELFLYERQAFVWKKKSDKFFLEPDCEETLEIRVLGKRGLTDGKIQIDYGNIEDVSSLERFYTRRVVVPVIVTVNGSIELVNCDIINYVNDNKEKENSLDRSEEMSSLFQYVEAHEHEGVEYCLALLDFRNIWPKPLSVYDKPFKIEKIICPGETDRFVLPLKRIFISLEDSRKPISTFSSRQFIASSIKTDSDTQDYQQRKTYWLREALFKVISGTWTHPGTDRKGFIELRGLRMTPKMVYCLKVEDISVTLEVSGNVRKIQRFTWLVKLCEFVTFTLKVINRKGYPIKAFARIQPFLRYQNQTFIDISHCVIFNGVMQTVLPRIDSYRSHEEKYTAVFMSRGEYEIVASIQELHGPDEGNLYASRSYSIVKCVDDIEGCD
ncbi:hypothetical protein PMAC_002611 [Pneumocystis sp. 'macacae']|nr:hypothetical protein PMAC_002611 [Pneumocystis sp. 'macacae']